ncbi:MAG: hypothetical protein R3A78_09690 [Polyangiales bacterium]
MDPTPSVGETFASIAGVLVLRGGGVKIMPRDGADVAAGMPGLSEFGPSPTYIRAGGGAGPTIPTALMVTLSRAPATSTTVTQVRIGRGAQCFKRDRARGHEERGGAHSRCDTVGDADHGLRNARFYTEQVSVRVIGASESPKVAAITPANATVPAGGSLSMRVELEIPAPPGGTTVTLGVSGGGSVPASVQINGNELYGTFTYTAPGSDASAMITATGPLNSKTTGVTMTTPRVLIINEVDHDQPSNLTPWSSSSSTTRAAR